MRVRLPPPPFLYAILDLEALGGRNVAEAVAALARGGAGLVQLRAKAGSDRERVSAAAAAVAAARGAGVPLIVNDRPDIARIVGADGVHVGQQDLPLEAARRVLGPTALVGVSTHDEGQLAEALATSADYIAVGPVYPTGTKADPDPMVGLGFVRRARALCERPLVAIGGITRQNARGVIEAGADGIAVVGDLFRSHDLAAEARALVSAFPGST